MDWIKGIIIKIKIENWDKERIREFIKNKVK